MYRGIKGRELEIQKSLRKKMRCSFCNSYVETSATEQSLERARAQLTGLQRQKLFLESERGSLKSEKELLTRANEKLKRELEREKEAHTRANEEFKRENEKVKRELERVKEELKREKEELKREKEEFKRDKEELKRENEEVEAKVSFLRICSPFDTHHCPGFHDVSLVTTYDGHGNSNTVSVPAHKAVLVARSPIFKDLLESDIKGSICGTIEINDVSNDALRTFIEYLYTAEIHCLDEELARDLLLLGDRYQLESLKSHCEKFFISKLNWENSITSFAFAQQYDAKHLSDCSLSIIINNIQNLTKTKVYSQLKENDPRLVVKIFESYLSKQLKNVVACSV